MEDISVLTKSDVLVNRRTRSYENITKLQSSRTTYNSAIGNLIAEGGETFINYLSRLNLDKKNNLLVLSAKHHYYYDEDDLRGITTLINLKKLNIIKHLDSFLHVVCNILSPKASFVGCFCDRETQKGIGLRSRISRRFINFLDNRIDNEIDKKDVSRLFESCGFKIIDMTDINGLTYFATRKNGSDFI